MSFSVLDGMGTVGDMVATVARYQQPAISLTDHGTMGGVVQGYKAAKKHGLLFFPGCEWYVVRDVDDPDTRGIRYHLGMLALDYEGYQAMIRLQSLSYQADRFYRKPIIDLSDLAFLKDEGYSEHLAITTGCHFGLVLQQPTVEQRESMVKTLARWFPNTYVELQNHGIQHPDGTSDLDDAETLYGIAQRLGLPVVVGQDSHYIHDSEQPVHDLMKEICYFGDGEDTKFPGGPFHLATAAEAMEVFPDGMHDALEAGHQDLLDKHRLALPALDNYKFHVPKVAKNPNRVLHKKVMQGLKQRGVFDKPRYCEQAEFELDVISQMDMPDYFLLVSDLTDWCRDNAMTVNTRGSANGSLVCYALGISEVDPVVWKVPFDRFLSLDRMKPPDIDIDVSSDKRHLLVAHMKAKYPSMVQIGTYGRIGITTSEEAGEADSGSVFVQYMAAMRSKKGAAFDGKVAPEHRKALMRLGDTAVRKSLGVNAAGFVLPGDSLPIDAYLPLARVVSSNTTVTQFFKDDVEALGYTKLDFLGVKMLGTLDNALLNIGRAPNDWDWIPNNDKEACKLLRSGNGVGLFQFEGYSTAKGGREMQVRSTADAILCLALYRPALMNGGQKDQYLYNRSKRGKQHQVRLHPLFDPILNDTAGVPLFQEHIMEMLRTLGMQYHDWNDLMTAVKASNGNIAGAADTFARVKPIFMNLCMVKGFHQDEARAAWDAIVGFTEYGFNKAHATSYGLMAYRSAYLKAHYPLEYMAAVLATWVGHKDKEPPYVAEARRLGATIVRADVNTSQASWSLHPTRKNALQKGLASIPGIGMNVADVIVSLRPEGGWRTMEEFVNDMPARPVSGGKDWARKGVLIGVMEKLRQAGALRSLGVFA